MTEINPAAAAARESAREHTGQFGEQTHSEPELALMGPYEPGQPVYATITFEEYAHDTDDSPIWVSEQKTDIATVLDTLPLAEVVEMCDNAYAYVDHVVKALQESGQLAHAQHPFTARLDAGDLDAYTDYREVHGQRAPLTDEVIPRLENLVSARDAHRKQIEDLRAQVKVMEGKQRVADDAVLRAITAEEYPEAVRLVVQLDHHRYPVEMYDKDDEWVPLHGEQEAAFVRRIQDLFGDSYHALGTARAPRQVALS